LLLATEYGKLQDYGECMEKAVGGNVRVSQRFSSRMEPFEPQRYTGMRPLALAERNSRSNTLWIKL